MSAAVLDLRRPALLPETDQATALEASRAVSRLIGRGAVHVEAVPVTNRTVRQAFDLPAPVVQLLTEILMHLGAGTPVTVIPERAELTTQQAAEFLNVSRPWIVKLIERGDLPHRMVGTHRRVLFSELRAYKERTDRSRKAALDRLAGEAQAMGEYE